MLVGSLTVRLEDGKLANRSLLIDSAGGVVTRYDKLHLFDVDLKGGETYRESANFEPGTEAVNAETPWGLLGLTICYDVRFPLLYRALARAGARFLTVPSAFTLVTGEAHWHILLRARAIETQTYVVAAAQTGTFMDGNDQRATWGHSMIVDPWGHMVAQVSDQPGFASAAIDRDYIGAVRGRIPVRDHRVF